MFILLLLFFLMDSAFGFFIVIDNRNRCGEIDKQARQLPVLPAQHVPSTRSAPSQGKFPPNSCRIH